MKRLALLHELAGHGGRSEAALVDVYRVGDTHGVPIERSPGGPIGHDLMVIPCLFVLSEAAA